MGFAAMDAKHQGHADEDLGRFGCIGFQAENATQHHADSASNVASARKTRNLFNLFMEHNTGVVNRTVRGVNQSTGGFRDSANTAAWRLFRLRFRSSRLAFLVSSESFADLGEVFKR